jgi:hypothetical protein
MGSASGFDANGSSAKFVVAARRRFGDEAGASRNRGRYLLAGGNSRIGAVDGT